jgi:hypothetical protein
MYDPWCPKTRAKDIMSSFGVRVNIILNGYQLANLLTALDRIENDGDWYNELQSKIGDSLGALFEGMSPPMNIRALMKELKEYSNYNNNSVRKAIKDN